MDARSVSDALAATDVCTPQEASLRLHLIAVRDRLTRGLIRSISWTDTRDMVADALTKGGVDRTLSTQVMNGQLTIHHPLQTQRGPSRVAPIRSAESALFIDELSAATSSSYGDLEEMD